MAMVESRIIAPVASGRIDRNAVSGQMRLATRAAITGQKPPPAVSISGEGLLKQRLSDKSKSSAINAADNKSQVEAKPAIEQLNKADRALISDIYFHAREQGADLKYVDELARNLARYREQQGDPDKAAKEPRGYFTDSERPILKRIRDSEALSSTRLDQDFVRYMTDPDNPRVHGNLEFMEQVMHRFSDKAGEASGLSSQFAQYSSVPKADKPEEKKPTQMPGLFGMLAKAMS